MKRLLLLLNLLPLLLHAQQITGKVMRINSDTVIAGASVYFGGSVKGTSTNHAGQFTLGAGSAKVPLVVSCVGYYSALITDYGFDKPLTVYLKPKQNLMREVHIGGDGMRRSEKLQLFKREFLGVSDNALSCTIVNIDDIELDYDRDTETLTAFCNDPIIVKNKRLGYTISYYLDRFVRNKNHVVFAGNYLFKEDASAANSKIVQVCREEAYAGSRMEFVRSLWSNTLTRNGYEVFDFKYTNIPADSVIYTNPGMEKYVRLKMPIRIVYKKDYSRMTYLSKREELSFIDKDGFYGAGLSWAGKMSSQRIGDMLPFEYIATGAK